MENKSRILLVVQDATGHSENEISWDPNNKQQVEAMRELFIKMRNEGFMFFKVDKKIGVLKSKGEQIVEFRPELKEMIMEKNLDFKPVEEETNGYESAEFFDPNTEEIEEEKKYVATQPVSGG